jgi:nitrogen fixation/metabolism regulation signal transduction histidine kinase
MKDVNGARELRIQSQRGGDGQVLISVTDTGVGLPRQQVDNIFDAFFTTKPNGTGMGLRISRSIVESHGGVCGLEITHPAAQVFISPYQARAGRNRLHSSVSGLHAAGLKQFVRLF